MQFASVKLMSKAGTNLLRVNTFLWLARFFLLLPEWKWCCGTEHSQISEAGFVLRLKKKNSSISTYSVLFVLSGPSQGEAPQNFSHNHNFALPLNSDVESIMTQKRGVKTGNWSGPERRIGPIFLLDGAV